ncbi:MAG TPA: hypothetical protein VGJ60_07325 [Chloroflexota bacterium]|jgi:hypothetical protein
MQEPMPLDMAEVRAAAQAQSDLEPVGADIPAPPITEVQLTRLVTFIVDTEAIRSDDDEPDDTWDPERAASDFVYGLDGADVDNYATIDYVYPALDRDILAALDFAIKRVEDNAVGVPQTTIDFYLRQLGKLRELVAGGTRS